MEKPLNQRTSRGKLFFFWKFKVYLFTTKFLTKILRTEQPSCEDLKLFSGNNAPEGTEARRRHPAEGKVGHGLNCSGPRGQERLPGAHTGCSQAQASLQTLNGLSSQALSSSEQWRYDE